MSSPHKKFFSTDLQAWLADESPKTVEGMVTTFGLRAAPSIIIILMALPALPIPTGGISHVLEIIAVIVAAQMVLGIDSVWVPKKLQSKEVSKKVLKTGMPTIIGNIKRAEKYSRARGTNFMTLRSTPRITGVILIIGILAAFFAPPFSGLDTFPAAGVVILALGLVLLDVSFWLIGVTIIALSVVLELTIGVAVIAGAKEFILHGNTTTRAIATGFVALLLAIAFIKHKKSQ